jgi:hypothetical protein
LWRRTHGKPSRLDKATKHQYLTSIEENALLDYVLRTSEREYPLPVKYLRSPALVVARQWSSAFQTPAIDDGIRPPGKKWPQDIDKRGIELKARQAKALDRARHDHNIHDKVMHWFSIIGKDLIYNMDETCVFTKCPELSQNSGE